MQRAIWATIIAGVATVTVTVAAGARAQREQQTTPAPALSDSQSTGVEAPAGMLDEHPAIQYATRPTRDRVSLLNQAIAKGTTALAFQEQGGYLNSVLDALG